MQPDVRPRIPPAGINLQGARLEEPRDYRGSYGPTSALLPASRAVHIEAPARLAVEDLGHLVLGDLPGGHVCVDHVKQTALPPVVSRIGSLATTVAASPDVGRSEHHVANRWRMRKASLY